jgi:hypothetical protein
VKIIDEHRQRLLQRDVEEDTRILSAKYVQIAGIPTLLERWSSDGIHGSTAVFLIEHVAGMDDAALQRLLAEQGLARQHRNHGGSRQ